MDFKKSFVSKIALIVLFVLFMIPISGTAMATGEKSNFPLGFPFASWGEFRFSENDCEGVIFDGYFEQGVDWWKFGNWTFNTFGATRYVDSDVSRDYWNNKIGGIVGAKFKHPLKIFPNSWGQLAIGIRGEWYDYFHSNRENVSCVLGFFQWSFGGDWKNMK